jgi:NADH-quinone oxidoreductase subunit N
MDYSFVLNDTHFFYAFESILLTYILACLSYSVFFAGLKDYAFPVLITSVGSFSLFIIVSFLVCFENVNTSLDFCVLYGVFGFTQILKMLLLFVSFSILFFCKDFLIKRNILKYEYNLVLIFSLLGLFLLNSSDDLLILYLALELQSLCFYVLATFKRNSEFCVESGMKYFVLGAFSSGILLFGFALIYTNFGTLSFDAITRLVSTSNSFLGFVGFLFVIVAFLFKLGAFPFHM